VVSFSLTRSGLPFILETIDTCCDRCLLYEPGSIQPTLESVEATIQKIRGYVSVEIRQKTDPHIKEIRYCVGILRNRFGAETMDSKNQKKAEDWLRVALEHEATSQSLRETAIVSSSFPSWTYLMKELVDKL